MKICGAAVAVAGMRPPAAGQFVEFSALYTRRHPTGQGFTEIFCPALRVLSAGRALLPRPDRATAVLKIVPSCCRKGAGLLGPPLVVLGESRHSRWGGDTKNLTFAGNRCFDDKNRPTDRGEGWLVKKIEPHGGVSAGEDLSCKLLFFCVFTFFLLCIFVLAQGLHFHPDKLTLISFSL